MLMNGFPQLVSLEYQEMIEDQNILFLYFQNETQHGKG